MDVLATLFAGLGGLSFIFVLTACFFFFFVHPIWAFVDVFESPRERDVKILVSLALFVTWGLGGWIYGLFFAASSLFKKVTRWGTLASFLLFVVGAGACTMLGLRSDGLQEKLDQEKSAALEKQIKSYLPGTIEVDAVSPFAAIHYPTLSSGQASLAAFNLLGPIGSSAQSVESGIRHVAYDSRDKRFFSITNHDFGSVSSKTGRFSEIEVDPSLEALSWPKGIAYDSGAHQVIVMTSHVYTRFYRYDPRKSEWALAQGELRDFPIEALAYASDDESLYTLDTSGDERIERIHRFNRNGAHLGSVELAIPILSPERAAAPPQLQYSSGHLMLIAPGGQIWVVDRASGALAKAN